MFFLVSKILAFLIKPFNWIVGFLLFGLLTKNPRRKRRLFRLSIGLILLFSNPFIINQLLRWWEIKPVQVSELKKEYDVGIVLGGYISVHSAAPNDRLNLNEAANRLVNALELYHQGKIKKILLTGASGEILYPEFKEAMEVTAFLRQAGVPDSSILVEPNSKNTYENIRNSKELLQNSDADASILLITSAFHMRRALAVCRKQKLEVTPYSTDLYQEKGSLAPNKWLLPEPKAFQIWGILFKEWVGIWAYSAAGYI